MALLSFFGSILLSNQFIIKFTQTQTRADVTVEVDFELVSYDLVDENELKSN